MLRSDVCGPQWGRIQNAMDSVSDAAAALPDRFHALSSPAPILRSRNPDFLTPTHVLNVAMAGKTEDASLAGTTGDVPKRPRICCLGAEKNGRT